MSGLSLLLLLLPAAGVQAGGLNWAEGVKRVVAPRIAIITTSDLQSNIYGREITDDSGVTTIGGIDRIAALSQRLRREVDGSLLVSTGDDLMGAFYSIFAGRPEIISMSMAGYDVVVPGNHEFDQGAQVYADAVELADFDILAANLRFTDPTLAAIVKPYVCKNIGEIKIGIFGLVTPTLKSITNVGDKVEVNRDIVAVAAEMVARLRAQGANLVVSLSHCGTILDRQVAANVYGLDLIVGGHSHESFFETVLNPAGKPCILVQAGVGGGQVGVLKFSFTGGIYNPQWELITLDESVGSDEQIKDYVAGYVDEFDRQLGNPIGETLVALDSRKDVIRQKESNLGNLVTDAVADWFLKDDGNPPLTMISSGLIRGDRVYSVGSISRKDVLTILPFGNTIVRVEMTGRQMRSVLEAAASALVSDDDSCPYSEHVSSGGFLQFSKAFKITIDPTQPSFCARYDGREMVEIINQGQRIVQVELFQDGVWQELSPEKTYTVYVNSWLAGGGDGHYVFAELKKSDSTVLVADALARFIELQSPVSPVVGGRIIIEAKLSDLL